MDQVFRVDLNEEEKKRRNEVVASFAKKRPEQVSSLLGAYKRAVPQAVVRRLSRLEKLPRISASYQFWFEDKLVWETYNLNRQQFPWPAPDKHGPPFSLTYHEAYIKKEDPHTLPEVQQSSVSGQAEDSKEKSDDWADAEAIPETWPVARSVAGPGITNAHANTDESRQIWVQLYPGYLWPAGCLPFEVPVPINMNPRLVLAAKPKELESLMLELCKRFSPHEPWCIRFFAKSKVDPKAPYGVRLWVRIDWPDFIDRSNQTWRQLLYRAGVYLMKWYSRLLDGEIVHILNDLETSRIMEWDQHHTLFRYVQTQWSTKH
ncbi:hypothetical protein GGS20DRAFT_591630 [Poronia punctata]|nr:hypothetical protein GGS20DRAFT_591630 [Poronia punctata]